MELGSTLPRFGRGYEERSTSNMRVNTVAGDTARHGKEVTSPPANPMSLEEAAAYVNYVVSAWLASKRA